MSSQYITGTKKFILAEAEKYKSLDFVRNIRKDIFISTPAYL